MRPPGGYGPKLPIGIDPEDGFGLTKTIVEQVKQNLKILLLTMPGERAMKPKFGVGLKRYLFEQNSLQLRQEITTKIREQVNIYMPFVDIRDVIFSDLESPESDENKLSISIRYLIKPLKTTDMLDVADDGSETSPPDPDHPGAEL